MKVLALAVAGFAALTVPAAAQYMPRPMMPIGPLQARDVFEIVREMGLDPVGPPMRNGPMWIQRAADYYGKPLRVVVDARRAEVVAVEPVGGMPGIYGGPYATHDPYERPLRPRIAPDVAAIAPPGSVMAPQAQPSHAQPLHAQPPQAGLPPAVQPKQKSAAVTSGNPPVPRKRPTAAPQEAAGSVEPLQAAPQAAAPATTGSTPSAAPAKPASPAMTPVAPLE
jgi:hypothetical protein